MIVCNVGLNVHTVFTQAEKYFKFGLPPSTIKLFANQEVLTLDKTLLMQVLIQCWPYLLLLLVSLTRFYAYKLDICVYVGHTCSV